MLLLQVQIQKTLFIYRLLADYINYIFSMSTPTDLLRFLVQQIFIIDPIICIIYNNLLWEYY